MTDVNDYAWRIRQFFRTGTLYPADEEEAKKSFEQEHEEVVVDVDDL